MLGRSMDDPQNRSFPNTSHPFLANMGVSENSVPLNPMVNESLSLLNGYNWEYTLFSDKPI